MRDRVTTSCVVQTALVALVSVSSVWLWSAGSSARHHSARRQGHVRTQKPEWGRVTSKLSWGVSPASARPEHSGFLLEAAGPPQQAEATPTSCQAGVPFTQRETSQEGAAVSRGTQPRGHVRPVPTQTLRVRTSRREMPPCSGEGWAAGSEGPPHRLPAAGAVSMLLRPKRVRRVLGGHHVL